MLVLACCKRAQPLAVRFTFLLFWRAMPDEQQLPQQQQVPTAETLDDPPAGRPGIDGAAAAPLALLVDEQRDLGVEDRAEGAARLLAAAASNAHLRSVVLECPELLDSLHEDVLFPATYEDCDAETVAVVSALLGDQSTPISLADAVLSLRSEDLTPLWEAACGPLDDFGTYKEGGGSA
jgi:hypothetical protein